MAEKVLQVRSDTHLVKGEWEEGGWRHSDGWRHAGRCDASSLSVESSCPVASHQQSRVSASRKKSIFAQKLPLMRYNTIILSRQSQNYFYLFKNVAEKIFSQIRTRYFNNQRVTLFAFVESVGETRTKKSLELELFQNIFIQWIAVRMQSVDRLVNRPIHSQTLQTYPEAKLNLPQKLRFRPFPIDTRASNEPCLCLKSNAILSWQRASPGIHIEGESRS